MASSLQAFDRVVVSLVADADKLRADARLMKRSGPVDVIRRRAELERRLWGRRNETQALVARNAKLVNEIRTLAHETEVYKAQASRLLAGNDRITQQLRNMQAAFSTNTRQFVNSGGAAGDSGAGDKGNAGGDADATSGSDASTDAQSSGGSVPRGATNSGFFSAVQSGALARAADVPGPGQQPEGGGVSGQEQQQDGPQAQAAVAPEAQGDGALVLSAGGSEDVESEPAGDEGAEEDTTAVADADADPGEEGGAEGQDGPSGGLGVLSFLATAAKVQPEVGQGNAANPSAALLGSNSEGLVKRLRSFTRAADQALQLEEQAASRLEAAFNEAMEEEKRKQQILLVKYRRLMAKRRALQTTQRGLFAKVQWLQAVRTRIKAQLRQQQEALQQLVRMATE